MRSLPPSNHLRLMLPCLTAGRGRRGGARAPPRQQQKDGPEKESLAIQPLIEPLGYDWKMGIGLIASFAAREVFVSTMGIVYGVGEDVGECVGAEVGECDGAGVGAAVGLCVLLSQQ